MLWENWLIQRRRWIPTLLIFPFLYLFGWLIVQPLVIFFPNIEIHDLSLYGTICTFISFLILLPSWAKCRWNKQNIFLSLGLGGLFSKFSLRSFSVSFIWALLLVVCVLAPLFLGNWATLDNSMSVNNVFNAILLGFGVGFAEELIFRGWLWSEINLLIGTTWGVFVQALIFSLVHIISLFDSNSWSFTATSILAFISLLIGLFLLGLVLAVRRILDKGSLSGCIALHGGLVGLWFFINSDLIVISKDTPIILIGPSNPTPNPIGGLIAISCLLCIIFCHRTAFAKAGTP